MQGGDKLNEDDISEVTRSNQIKRIIEYLKTHDGITGYEAIKNISVMRLASRVCDMEKLGIKIDRKWVSGVNKYGEKWRAKKYWIVEGNK